eukprot:TCALIF_05956-PA protein Name:"Protein of unknown function" AED:0.30 eAED:0.41 QI:0/0/0/1/0/0/5/0/223
MLGVSIRPIVMDGTIENISAFNALGCNLHPQDIDMLKTHFKHPHSDAGNDVYVLFDPDHMAKNIMESLDYRVSSNSTYEEQVEHQNDEHPTGNRSMGTVIDIHPSNDGLVRAVIIRTPEGIMKRPITKIYPLQPLTKSSNQQANMSHLFGPQIFHDRIFDILNDGSKFGREFKATLSLLNYKKVSEHFDFFTALSEAFETISGQKIIYSLRKTCPLGFLNCIS